MAKRGPKTEAGRARSLANLTPFKPGDVGNPAGRPPAGASIREWWNVMQDWSIEQVNRVLSDPQSGMAKRTAAVQWLAAFEGNGGSVDRIFDRTEGKPKGDGTPIAAVTVNVTQLSRDDLVRIAATGRCRTAEA